MPPKRSPGQSGIPGSGSTQVPVFLGGPAPSIRALGFFTECQAGSVPVVGHCVVVEVVPVVEAARRADHRR